VPEEYINFFYSAPLPKLTSRLSSEQSFSAQRYLKTLAYENGWHFACL